MTAVLRRLLHATLCWAAVFHVVSVAQAQSGVGYIDPADLALFREALTNRPWATTPPGQPHIGAIGSFRLSGDNFEDLIERSSFNGHNVRFLWRELEAEGWTVTKNQALLRRWIDHGLPERGIRPGTPFWILEGGEFLDPNKPISPSLAERVYGGLAKHGDASAFLREMHVLGDRGYVVRKVDLPGGTHAWGAFKLRTELPVLNAGEARLAVLQVHGRASVAYDLAIARARGLRFRGGEGIKGGLAASASIGMMIDYAGARFGQIALDADSPNLLGFALMTQYAGRYMMMDLPVNSDPGLPNEWDMFHSVEAGDAMSRDARMVVLRNYDTPTANDDFGALHRWKSEGQLNHEFGYHPGWCRYQCSPACPNAHPAPLLIDRMGFWILGPPAEGGPWDKRLHPKRDQHLQR